MRSFFVIFFKIYKEILLSYTKQDYNNNQAMNCLFDMKFTLANTVVYFTILIIRKTAPNSFNVRIYVKHWVQQNT